MVYSCVLCSLSAYRGPITLFSRTSGVWVCLWLKWLLVVFLSHHLMLRNWNRFLASLWKERPPLPSPPQSHGPLGDQASVSLSSLLNSVEWLLSIMTPLNFGKGLRVSTKAMLCFAPLPSIRTRQ